MVCGLSGGGGKRHLGPLQGDTPPTPTTHWRGGEIYVWSLWRDRAEVRMGAGGIWGSGEVLGGPDPLIPSTHPPPYTPITIVCPHIHFGTPPPHIPPACSYLPLGTQYTPPVCPYNTHTHTHTRPGTLCANISPNETQYTLFRTPYNILCPYYPLWDPPHISPVCTYTPTHTHFGAPYITVCDLGNPI